MKLKLAATLAVASILFGSLGCASYAKTGAWAPQGANYTISRDRQTGELTDYFGLNWSFK